MEMRVHNIKEATALVKEWNSRGEMPAEEITFFKHETDDYIGRVFWSNDYDGFIWED